MLCSYGCGKKAKFFFKNGNGCCEISPNKCENKRKKDSELKKGSFNGTPEWSMEGFKPREPWNKGKKNIYTSEYRKKISDSLTGVSTGRSLTKEGEEKRIKKISESMKNHPNGGGYRRGSGRGKKGFYKGIWCDSSWELSWVIYHIDNKIPFERNQYGFEYTYNNEKHLYYPDFISDGKYYEIKGRKNYESLDKKTKEKINSFDGELIVLYEKDMKYYLNYSISMYGKNFVNLYENTV